MEKLDPQIKVTDIDDSTEQLPVPSKIFGAPEPSLTAPDTTPIGTGSGLTGHVSDSAAATIENMRTRLNELETILVRKGIIKSR